MTKFKHGFTLAEVLITLAIIGVVAALTIPTLVAKINQKVSENRQTTIEARLLDGINRYSAQEDGLSQPYNTTYDFLVGLSKFYKMAQICKADEITKCIPYSTITYTSDGEDATVEVSSLTSIDNFMSEAKDDYLAPASFITAQGTPVIMAFKKDCVWDMGKAMRSIQDSGCIAYMYDESGTRLPNKFGKDIIPHGLTIVSSSGATPIAVVGGYKIMNQAFFSINGLSKSECDIEKAKNYGIDDCSDDIDNWENGNTWAAAMKYCHDNGWRLPNQEEASAIISGLFKTSSGSRPTAQMTTYSSLTYTIDFELINTLGIKHSNGYNLTASRARGYFLYLWGTGLNMYYGVRENAGAYYRLWYYTNKYYINDRQVLCISD